MRTRSCNFQKNLAPQPGPRRLAPGPGFNRLKSKRSTFVPLKTLKLKALWEEGTKMISIAKLHIEVLRMVKPKKFGIWPPNFFKGLTQNSVTKLKVEMQFYVDSENFM